MALELFPNTYPGTDLFLSRGMGGAEVYIDGPRFVRICAQLRSLISLSRLCSR